MDDLELFLVLIEEDQPVPVDLESRLVDQGIDTRALRNLLSP